MTEQAVRALRMGCGEPLRPPPGRLGHRWVRVLAEDWSDARGRVRSWPLGPRPPEKAGR